MTDLSKYLTSEIKDFLFTEISDEFLGESDLSFLSGVPIPIRRENLKDFGSGGLSAVTIADNMSLVIGADGSFKYKEYYLRYLKKVFDEKLTGVLCSRAEDLLSKNTPRKAICYLRAALLLDPQGLKSMYCYANGCRIWYQSLEGSDDTELIAALKAEANTYFSQTTNIHPDFAPAWYFLGYAYLNAGVYRKAEIAFRHYIQHSEGQPEEDKKEVGDRLEELKDPVRIEEGKNLLIAGKVYDALAILEPYAVGKYEKWWPIHYYLAAAYDSIGHAEEAKEGYLKVLELNPSNYDAMTALSDLYEKSGDLEKAKKYADKAKIVLENLKEQQ